MTSDAPGSGTDATNRRVADLTARLTSLGEQLRDAQRTASELRAEIQTNEVTIAELTAHCEERDAAHVEVAAVMDSTSYRLARVLAKIAHLGRQP